MCTSTEGLHPSARCGLQVAVVQVRGFGNRLPSVPVKAIIARWAELEGLQLAY